MPKEEWGTKRVCPDTGKRFYDLGRDPIVSPYTGKVVELDTGRSRTMVADKADKASESKAAEADDLLEGDDLVEEDESEMDIEDDVLEDDEDEDVSLDEIADVAAPEEE